MLYYLSLPILINHFAITPIILFYKSSLQVSGLRPRASLSLRGYHLTTCWTVLAPVSYLHLPDLTPGTLIRLKKGASPI